MSYCQLLLLFPVGQFWLYVWHGTFHNHLKLLWKFQTCVCLLISYGWHRHTHTHTHTLRYKTVSTRKFFSFKYVTEKFCQWLRSCSVSDEWVWSHDGMTMTGENWRKSVPLLLWLPKIWQIGMALNFLGERLVTAGYRHSLIMFCHSNGNLKEK
jgi:hypothetical protein